MRSSRIETPSGISKPRSPKTSSSLGPHVVAWARVPLKSRKTALVISELRIHLGADDGHLLDVGDVEQLQVQTLGARVPELRQFVDDLVRAVGPDVDVHRRRVDEGIGIPALVVARLLDAP